MQQRLAILLSAASLVITAACSQSDTGITTAVKAKMAADDTVKASEINVDTHNHVVTLNGTVGSQTEKERAVLIARDTRGVTSVVDDIIVGPVPAATTGAYEQKAEDTAHEAKVKTEDAAHDAKVKTENAAHDAKVKTEKAADKTGEVLTDAAVTSEVKTKFLAEPGVSGLNINVDTTNGVVTLTGMVKSQAEANKAMTIARNSKGVKRVVNHLKVG
ncbi:MAG TPA: BON domain-containing protein [Vicinamibacterales bacterium]|jgi:hyperosmotically inducible protein